MIGDSWQLCKYSLLGHWAVHCVVGPQILAHMQNGKVRAIKGAGGWTTQSKKNGGAWEKKAMRELLSTWYYSGMKIKNWTERRGGEEYKEEWVERWSQIKHTQM